MQHFIGKQQIELQLARIAEPFALQQQLSESFQNKIVPAMEELFNLYSTPDVVIHIDRLVIDIGPITQGQLNSDAWSLLVIKELQRVLEEAKSVDSPVHIQKTAAPRRVFDLWLYFLRVGHLPYQSRLPNNLESEIIQSLEADPTSIGALRHTLSSQPRAIHRLVMQHQEAFLSRLLNKLSGAEHSLFKEMSVAWVSFWSAGRQVLLSGKSRLKIASGRQKEEEQATFRANFNAALQQMAIHWGETSAIGQDKYSTEGIKRHAIVWFWRKLIQEIIEYQGFSASQSNQVFTRLFHRLLGSNDLKTALEILNTGDHPHLKPLIAFVLSETFQHLPEVSVKNSAKEMPALQEAISQNTEEDDHQLLSTEVDNLWYLDGAGVVLLHPFLTTIFQKLKWIKNGTFKSEECRHKAVLLLHYLWSGKEHTEESAMVLPKILCGMPLQSPVDAGLTLKSKEKAEAETLLEVVVEHWGALGNASTDALREGFLQRAGKLQTHSLGRQLKIEQNTLDILLQQLPWGIGMIRLPWMHDLLTVEWG